MQKEKRARRGSEWIALMSIYLTRKGIEEEMQAFLIHSLAKVEKVFSKKLVEEYISKYESLDDSQILMKLKRLSSKETVKELRKLVGVGFGSPPDLHPPKT